MPVTYAVASDLSDIVETDDGFGPFTKLEALNYQISLLEIEREQIAGWLKTARRRKRAEQARLLRAGS